MNKEQDNNLLLSIFQCCDIRILTVCFKLLQTIVQRLKRDKAGNSKQYNNFLLTILSMFLSWNTNGACFVLCRKVSKARADERSGQERT